MSTWSHIRHRTTDSQRRRTPRPNRSASDPKRRRGTTSRDGQPTLLLARKGCTTRSTGKIRFKWIDHVWATGTTKCKCPRDSLSQS